LFNDLVYGLKELRKSREEYERAEDYYYGTQEERFVSLTMARLLQGTGTDFKVNLSKRPVDAVLDRLEIGAITSPKSTITKVINEKLWMANQLDIEAHDVHWAAETYGDSYIFVWGSGGVEKIETSEDDSHYEIEGSTEDEAGVDIFYNSPLTVRAFYDDENPRKKKFVIKCWEQDRCIRINLYYVDRIERYKSKPLDEMTGQDVKDYDIYTDEIGDEDGVIPNPYNEIPFFHFRTARPYGRAEHADAYGPQDALTKLITNMMATSDFAAFPQRYATTAMGGSPGDDDDFDTGLSADESTTPDQMFSQLVAGPGRVWLLKNIDKIGQFPAADVRNFLEPIQKFVHMMSATTATPMPYFDPSREIPSGESQRALEAPLIKKINARQRSFGATWREAFKFALGKVLGLGKDIEVTVRWAATQLINDFTGWQAINEKQRAGVPTRQCLLEAGYTEAEVDSWGYTEEKPWGQFGRPNFDLFGTTHNSPFAEDDIPGENPPVQQSRPGNGKMPQDASNAAASQKSGTIPEPKPANKEQAK
jgi:Phage portal protein, SPP1 Gp6-like